MTDSHHISLALLSSGESEGLITSASYNIVVGYDTGQSHHGVAVARNAVYAQIVRDALYCLIDRDGQAALDRLFEASRG